MPVGEEIVTEIVFDVFLKLYNYPGAFINHLTFKNGKPLKVVVKQYFWGNLVLSTPVYGIILLLITS